jgi:hypothetical protein
VTQPAQRRSVAGAQRFDRLRDACILSHEVFEPAAKRVRRPSWHVAVYDQILHSFNRRSMAGEGCCQRAAYLLPRVPDREEVASAVRQPIVRVTRISGLLRTNRAGGSDQGPLTGNTNDIEQSHRHERESRYGTCLAEQHRGVILAPAVRADPGVAVQLPEGGAILQ